MSPKEIAQKVAEACQLEIKEFLEHVSVRRPWNRQPDGEPEWCVFEPDVCVNDAVYAAEKYGLFLYRETEMTGLLLDSGGPGSAGWQVTHRMPNPPGWKPGTATIGQGTFCEAICQAILWFEERKPKG